MKGKVFYLNKEDNLIPCVFIEKMKNFDMKIELDNNIKIVKGYKLFETEDLKSFMCVIDNEYIINKNI